MNACLRRKKSICWLVLGILPGADREELIGHLGDCEGCSEYYRALSSITGQLKVEFQTDVEASEIFHRRLLTALDQQPRPATISLQGFTALWPRLSLGWGTAASIVVLAMAVGFIFLESQRPAPLTAPSRPLSGTPASIVAAPSLARYQVAAERSLEEFDAVLTSESLRGLPPLPPAVFADALD